MLPLSHHLLLLPQFLLLLHVVHFCLNVAFNDEWVDVVVTAADDVVAFAVVTVATTTPIAGVVGDPCPSPPSRVLVAFFNAALPPPPMLHPPLTDMSEKILLLELVCLPLPLLLLLLLLLLLWCKLFVGYVVVVVVPCKFVGDIVAVLMPVVVVVHLLIFWTIKLRQSKLEPFGDDDES